MNVLVRPYPYNLTLKFDGTNFSIYKNNSDEAVEETELADQLILEGMNYQKEVVQSYKNLTLR